MNPSDAAILVVDDISDNRYTLCHRLRRQGYADLEEATNGREALERVAARPFDLVLLDIMMPEMDGYEVLERLKADATWRHIPVIMISALSEFDSVVRCIELGAEDYLPKPFNSVLLKARVSASLERKRLHNREAAHLAELERKTEQLAAAYAQIEQELEVAQSLQRAILPQDFPRCAECTGHALMWPARHLAGDFYDVLELPDRRLGVLIADVSGKGVAAAFFMGISRTVLRAAAREGRSPGACLARANDVLCRTNPMDLFVTVFYGILNPRDGTFFYANGGHTPPLLVRNGARVPTLLEGTGSLALGALEGIPYPERSVRLEPGDAVLLYTDGVTEARNAAGEEFAEERLIRAAGETQGLAPGAMTAHVAEAVRAFTGGGALADDLTCLVLCYVGAAAAA